MWPFAGRRKKAQEQAELTDLIDGGGLLFLYARGELRRFRLEN